MNEQEIYRCHGCHTQKKISLAFCESCHTDSRAVMNKILRVFPEQQIREQLEVAFETGVQLGRDFERNRALPPTDYFEIDESVEALRVLWEQK